MGDLDKPLDDSNRIGIILIIQDSGDELDAITDAVDNLDVDPSDD